jgi:sensor histidine kinase YesM
MKLLAHGLLGRFIQICIANTLIAIVISRSSPHGFWIDLIYSQSIGLFIWAWVDIGRRWFFAGKTSSYRYMLWWAPTGIVIGYIVGNLVGDFFSGYQLLHLWRDRPQLATGFLILTFTAGIAGTYYFITQEEFERHRKEQAELRTQATEAQLKLLQSQLDPHMLFNTLANLRALINSDPQRANHMLDRLNDYLRSTLNASRATEHALSAEFDRLRDYLELMQIRMGERLRYTLDLPAALASLPVPPLILQSLVENAIVHGLEPQVAGGEIHVSAKADGNMLELQVRDTGAGFDPANTPEGFGITQVRERITTRYGAQGTMHLVAACASFPWASGPKGIQNTLSDASADHAAPHGTIAVLRLPLTPASTS